MGLLINGEWHDDWYDTESTQGRFEREAATFRDWVTPDGEPRSGTSGGDGRGFEAEAGRYHLYASYACPWSHRALLFRRLKGLEKIVSLSITHWLMGEHGWTFTAGEGVIGDPHCEADYLYEIYQSADPEFTGRVTVPVLWDTKSRTIVNNESADIIRMFNSAFDDVGAVAGDYYPEPLREDIDAINERVYERVNNGVYKAGFATSQEAYEEAVEPLFETLDWLDDRLARRRYLLGERLTEADWRLFPTLIRFDAVYHGHFKCNLRRIVDYDHLWPYLRDLYQHRDIAGTVRMDHIQRHYYMSHVSINPNGIVPAGPELDLHEAPDRERLAA